MMKTKEEIEHVLNQIENELGPIVTLRNLVFTMHKHARLNNLDAIETESGKLLRKLKKRYQILDSKHYFSPEFEIYTKSQDIDLFYLSLAFSHNHTYSHFSALFINGLINQRPSDVYLSKYSAEERKAKSIELSSDRLKMAFQKSPRFTNKIIQFKKNDIFFIEKLKIEEKYISKIDFKYKEYDLQITVTNKYKSLIDSIVSPQYSGGITNVIEAFENFKELEVEQLYNIYKELNLTYPYWQSIGLILENKLGIEKANKWTNLIKINPIEFYLTKGYEPNWRYDEKWKIHYPDIF